MDKETFDKLIDSFRKIYEQKTILSSYINYYNALVLWLKEHSNLLSIEQLKTNRLDILLNIDSQKYVISNPELSLNQEYKRIGERDYETIEELIMSISTTLWDLVTIRTGIDCPNCIDDELRYVIAENKEKGIHELLLECETCGWTEHSDGKQWKEEIVNIIPASMEEIKNKVHKI